MLLDLDEMELSKFVRSQELEDRWAWLMSESQHQRAFASPGSGVRRPGVVEKQS